MTKQPRSRRVLLAGLGSAVVLSLTARVAHADDEPVDDDTTPAPDPLQCAYDQLFKPYIWASAAGRSYFGANPAGFDCSGFSAWWARQNGLVLPASTSAAWAATVPTSDPQPGDYAFWFMRNPSPRAQHMAVYLGDGLVIQSGGRRAYVNVDSAWAIGTPSFRRLPS